MKCLQCVSEGLRSEVYPGKLTTKIVSKFFYDENGRAHNHAETVIREFTCSKGHSFEVDSRIGCSIPGCEYAADDPTHGLACGTCSAIIEDPQYNRVQCKRCVNFGCPMCIDMKEREHYVCRPRQEEDRDDDDDQ